MPKILLLFFSPLNKDHFGRQSSPLWYSNAAHQMEFRTCINLNILCKICLRLGWIWSLLFHCIFKYTVYIGYVANTRWKYLGPYMWDVLLLAKYTVWEGTGRDLLACRPMLICSFLYIPIHYRLLCLYFIIYREWIFHIYIRQLSYVGIRNNACEMCINVTFTAL